MRGVDGRGKKCSFTPEEKERIKNGYTAMSKQISGKK